MILTSQAVFQISSLVILVCGAGFTSAKIQSEVSAGNNTTLAWDSYTEEEIQKIPKFRARVSDGLTYKYMFEDKYLVRFLRAKNLNVDEAEKLIRENFKWRKEVKMDNLIRSNMSNVARYLPFYFTLDRQKRPGIVSRLHAADIRKIVLRGEVNEIRNYFLYALERGVLNLHLISNLTGQELIEGYLLFNLAGFNRRSHACTACIPLWLEVVQIYESYFPRIAYKIIAINTPRIIYSLADIIKPYVGINTFEKIEVYTVDRSQWGPMLLQLFPRNQLPADFGGNSKLVEISSLSPREYAKHLLDKMNNSNSTKGS